MELHGLEITPREHPGMIQVFLSHNGGHDVDGNELPHLVYVSRENRLGFQHHKKAGAMNALINMKGLDGIQDLVYVGTSCVFRYQALYGYNPPKGPKRPKMVSCDCCPYFGRRKKPRFDNNDTFVKKFKLHSTYGIGIGVDEDKQMLMSQMNFDKRFGQSVAFVTSTLMEQGGVPPSSSPAALLKEATQVISYGHEDKTEWRTELGWIYSSITEDILTGFKMHCHGWRSVYYMPGRPAFKGSAPINLSDRINQVLRWALGSVEIFFSRHNPVCTFASLFFIALFISIFAMGILELRWSGVSIEEWWRNEQF
ncbi:hypothetical protein IEQ34_008239 [Dendrobium chrysotoxum]|uniref:Uncharacterized protein n=1 Tax=Dendrobium chrysotoxum TaxID=161865 RepID=A0AAV7H5L1_DENCH|nr:hypothetical protein IEQ34_008239 [Dendrobium chrysotoxum]